ncbi:MAG: 50S ribosomal protein L11 methyltransferase [Deltaproteobacteria bacterium]|jgi:ribosomal protein L11 methylase PrmA|nr:50S ribosomal protein L11 methyltransferase [Deltaproteobacteria bacterium]
MRPDTLLSIYELRACEAETRSLLDHCDLKSLVGPQLEGYHWEADFAFLFCSARADMGRLFAAVPGLELRKEHLLRYDEWQDGANARPIVLGPLSILPWEGDGVPEEKTADGSIGGVCGWPKKLPPVYIDPGLAFGYGGHPTTRACLGFLLRIMSPQNRNPPKTFLDLGCGTGVLALAALRLGGENALGVDYSHLAAECAVRNARLNRMAGKCVFEHGQAADRAGHPAEVLMANLPLAVHLELLDNNAYSVRRYLILSGLLPREANELKSRLKEALDFRELDNHRDERWSSWLLEIRDSDGS